MLKQQGDKEVLASCLNLAFSEQFFSPGMALSIVFNNC